MNPADFMLQNNLPSSATPSENEISVDFRIHENGKCKTVQKIKNLLGKFGNVFSDKNYQTKIRL